MSYHNNSLDNMFQKNRIRVEELVQDSIAKIIDTFKQEAQMFTVASAYGQIIFVLHQLVQMVFYYIEDSITELNINQATRQNSIYGISRLTGHNPTRSISAIGEINVGWNGEQVDIPGGIIIIPKNTRLKCENNGLTYLIDSVEEDVRLKMEKTNTINVNIVQGNVESQVFQGTGDELQSFEVNFKKNVAVENFLVDVYVNGEKWKVYDSLWDIPRGVKGCLVKTGITSGIDIYFGNNHFGLPPTFGSEITVEYVISEGSRGNLDGRVEDVTFKWSDPAFSLFGDEIDLNESVNINLNINPDFGSNPEPVALTRLIAPKTSRSFVLANPTNYITFFEKFNVFSIIDAYSTFDDDYLDDDNVIYLFLIPDILKKLKSNENYFTIDESKFKLSDFQKLQLLQLIEQSGGKIVTTEVSVVDPIIKRYVLNISITIFEKNNPDTIKGNIVSRLSEYFLSIRRRDKIPRSDLIAIIEGVAGVDSVSLGFVSQTDEALLAIDPEAETTGMDEFGDIVIGRDELPIIRGGWQDRNGFEYNAGLDFDRPSSVNIDIKKIIPSTYNTDLNTSRKKIIRDQ